MAIRGKQAAIRATAKHGAVGAMGRGDLQCAMLCTRGVKASSLQEGQVLLRWTKLNAKAIPKWRQWFRFAGGRNAQPNRDKREIEKEER